VPIGVVHANTCDSTPVASFAHVQGCGNKPSAKIFSINASSPDVP